MFARAFSKPTKNRRQYRLLGIALCVGALSSCATLPKGVDLPDVSDWQTRQQVLGNISAWQFKGRIAVKAGDDGFNAKFNWHQEGAAFSASVSGPLGIGTVLIEGDDAAMTLTDKDGIQTMLVDPEAELYYRYGWTIPVKTLRFWALGIPDPRLAADTELDEESRLRRLEQSGWTVEVSRYRESAGQDLPRIMTASNSDSRVRMVIDRWIILDR